MAVGGVEEQRVDAAVARAAHILHGLVAHVQRFSRQDVQTTQGALENRSVGLLDALEGGDQHHIEVPQNAKAPEDRGHGGAPIGDQAELQAARSRAVEKLPRAFGQAVILRVGEGGEELGAKLRELALGQAQLARKDMGDEGLEPGHRVAVVPADLLGQRPVSRQHAAAHFLGRNLGAPDRRDSRVERFPRRVLGQERSPGVDENCPDAHGDRLAPQDRSAAWGEAGKFGAAAIVTGFTLNSLFRSIRPLWARFGSHALLVALLTSACATPGSDARAAEATAQLAAARSASRAQHWSQAAGLWHEMFLRGGRHEEEACAQTARALLELGDHKSAQHQAELGSRRFPMNGRMHALRAEALEAQGFQRTAETAYESALKLDPAAEEILLALARLRCEIGKYEAALELLAPRLDSGRALAVELQLAARAQRALKRFPDALLSFERAFALGNPGVQALVDAATIYAEDGVRRQDARAAANAGEWLTRALALDPQHTLAHIFLGMIAEDQQRDGEAADCYRRAVETDPASVRALTALAQVQSRRGELADSMAMAERALALEKDPAARSVLEALARPQPAPQVNEGNEGQDAPLKSASDG